jgi:hypothetical protein
MLTVNALLTILTPNSEVLMRGSPFAVCVLAGVLEYWPQSHSPLTEPHLLFL